MAQLSESELLEKYAGYTDEALDGLHRSATRRMIAGVATIGFGIGLGLVNATTLFLSYLKGIPMIPPDSVDVAREEGGVIGSLLGLPIGLVILEESRRTRKEIVQVQDIRRGNTFYY